MLATKALTQKCSAKILKKERSDEKLTNMYNKDKTIYRTHILEPTWQVPKE